MTPTEILRLEDVAKIVAEAEDGSFGVHEKHIDFLTSLVPGILACVSDRGKEQFFAVDGGIFVKCGSEALVSTRNAIRGPDLGELKETVEEQYRKLRAEETTVRSALAKLEAEFTQRLLEVEGHED